MPMIEDNHLLFGLIIAKQIVNTVVSSMFMNAGNIVVVRMQNVEYKHNRSLFKAIKDLFLIDGHRMFYRGLIPISIGCANLSSVVATMNAFRSSDNILTHYIWPVYFALGCTIVHPFYLIGMRVQCAPFSPAAKANGNMFDCFQYVMKT